MSIFSKWFSLIKGSLVGNLLTGWLLSANLTRSLQLLKAIALTFTPYLQFASTFSVHTTSFDNKQISR